MFPLIPAIAPAIGMLGTAATALTGKKRAGSAAAAAADPYGAAKTQYEGTYGEMYDRTRGDTRDSAILQGLANTGGGSAGSGASAMAQMGQRAGAVQANANMAAHDAARGYAGGVQQQMLGNASAYQTYANEKGTGNANMLGALAQIPSGIGGMIGGIDEEFKKNRLAKELEAAKLAPQAMGAPAAPSTGQPQVMPQQISGYYAPGARPPEPGQVDALGQAAAMRASAGANGAIGIVPGMRDAAGAAQRGSGYEPGGAYTNYGAR